MSGHLTAKLGLPAALAMCTLCATPAAAQDIPTTPIPSPANPGQPPASAPHGVPYTQPVIGQAGTALGMVRILPKLIKTDTIIGDPSFEDKLPRQPLAEFGFGVSEAQANSQAYLEQERSTAQAKPLGVALGGRSPTLPGTLAVNSPSGTGKPMTRSLGPPPSPADQVLKANGLQGSVAANWTNEQGPCVGTIADSSTSLGSMSAINVLPGGSKAPAADGHGSLLSVPDSLRTHSTVRLVDAPGLQGKAVQSVSTIDGGSIRLLAGTPNEIRIDIVSQPTLTATHTGDPATSLVDYQAPVLRITQGDREIGVLDAAHPTKDIPTPTPAPMPHVLNAGVLRLSIGNLRQGMMSGQIGGGARMFDLQLLPTKQLGVDHPSALADVSLGEQTVRAGAPNGGVVCGPDAAGPAPRGGSGGGPAGHVAPANYDGPPAQRVSAPQLAQTGPHATVTLFWTGVGLLLTGGIVLAVLPRRLQAAAARRPREALPDRPES